MPLVELEDKELARLRGIERDYPDAANWRKAWGDIVNDPDLKMPAWELFKKKNPNVPVPEYDTAKAAAKPFEDRMAAMEKKHDEEIAELKAQASEREKREKESAANNTIEAGRRKLKARGFSDELIKQTEDLMQERGIGDYDVVAEYIASQMPKPAMLNQAYEGRDLDWFNPGDDAPDAKLLMENPRKYKNDMIQKFLADKANGNMQAWAA